MFIHERKSDNATSSTPITDAVVAKAMEHYYPDICYAIATGVLATLARKQEKELQTRFSIDEIEEYAKGCQLLDGNQEHCKEYNLALDILLNLLRDDEDGILAWRDRKLRQQAESTKTVDLDSPSVSKRLIGD